MKTRQQIEEHLLTRHVPSGWEERSVLPDYAGYSIVNLADLVAAAFELESRGTPLASASTDLPPHDHVVLLLLDGLGYRMVESLFDRYPDLALRSVAEAGRFVPLTSVFPSTTVASLVSISTGLTPLEHGLLGYRLYLRETSAITNMIRFAMVGNGRSDAAFGAGLDPETLLPAPTAHERLGEAGVDVHTLLPQHIARSGLSRALYRGTGHAHPAAGFADMLVTARGILEHATSPTFLSLYWPGLDTIAHTRGPHTDAYTAELRAIDGMLRHELLGRSRRTLLIITSDHGFVSMNAEDYLRLEQIPNIETSLMLPPVGEPRASYLYVREGERERMTRALSERLSDGLVCTDSQVLVDDGVLGRGTPHPEALRRIGDIALVSTGRAGLFHPYQDAVLLRGMHGGVTEDEMLVPLIIATL